MLPVLPGVLVPCFPHNRESEHFDLSMRLCHFALVMTSHPTWNKIHSPYLGQQRPMRRSLNELKLMLLQLHLWFPFLLPLLAAIVTPLLPVELAERITSTWLESSSGPCLTWRNLTPLYPVGVTFLVTPISFRTHVGAEASTLQTASRLFSIESMEVSLVFLYICSCYFGSILLCVWTREMFS